MRKRGRYGYFLKYIVRLGNILWLNISFLIMFRLFDQYIVEEIQSSLQLVIFLLNICVIPIIYHIKDDLMSDRLFPLNKIIRISFIWAAIHLFLFASCLTFAQLYNISRVFFFSFYLVFYIGLSLWWIIATVTIRLYRKRGYNYVKVLILGDGDDASMLVAEMNFNKASGYKIVGYLSNGIDKMIPNQTCLGRISDLEEVINRYDIDEVYSVLHSSVPDYLHILMSMSEKNFARFFIIPNYHSMLHKKTKREYIGNIPIVSTRREPLEGLVNRFMKRSFDIVFSGLFLLTIFPFVLLAVAIAIRISSPGPIFFKQSRTGLNGREFYCLKFRSMKVNKDSDLQQAVKGDSRITKLGSFLRKTSIDELPQFINVFMGDMSVVGPRPHMVKHTNEYSQLIDKYMVRHFVKPGITGWAQVNGFRGETNELWMMEKRVELDVWYIENWTFVLDMWIVLKTALSGLIGDKMAY